MAAGRLLLNRPVATADGGAPITRAKTQRRKGTGRAARW